MGLISGKKSDMVILVLIFFRFVQSAIIKSRLLHGVDSVHYWRVKFTICAPPAVALDSLIFGRQLYHSRQSVKTKEDGWCQVYWANWSLNHDQHNHNTYQINVLQIGVKTKTVKSHTCYTEWRKFKDAQSGVCDSDRLGYTYRTSKLFKDLNASFGRKVGQFLLVSVLSWNKSLKKSITYL